MTATLIPEAQRDTVWVRDWTYSNRSYFEAVELEKRMMFIILTLIIAVAAFNLVSSLVMAVTEKQADIAILRTLGLSPVGVMKIFMVQGAFSGFSARWRVWSAACFGVGTSAGSWRFLKTCSVSTSSIRRFILSTTCPVMSIWATLP